MSQLNPTLGERRVKWFFVASGNDVADQVKTRTAGLIDLMSAYRDLNPEFADKAEELYVQACEAAQVLFANENSLKNKKN